MTSVEIIKAIIMSMIVVALWYFVESKPNKKRSKKEIENFTMTTVDYIFIPFVILGLIMFLIKKEKRNE